MVSCCCVYVIDDKFLARPGLMESRMLPVSFKIYVVAYATGIRATTIHQSLAEKDGEKRCKANLKR
jgi:hypothetical protein